VARAHHAAGVSSDRQFTGASSPRIRRIFQIGRTESAKPVAAGVQARPLLSDTPVRPDVQPEHEHLQLDPGAGPAGWSTPGADASGTKRQPFTAGPDGGDVAAGNPTRSRSSAPQSGGSDATAVNGSWTRLVQIVPDRSLGKRNCEVHGPTRCSALEPDHHGDPDWRTSDAGMRALVRAPISRRSCRIELPSPMQPPAAACLNSRVTVW
jgi:hypothetical protein